MARAFVAVVPPSGVLDAVARAAAEARAVAPGARWTAREKWHLTLQFLGNHVDLDATAAALGGIAQPRGTVAFGGGGAFPRPRSATVLWIGVAQGGSFLAGLARAVGERLVPLGLTPDNRPYRAHLTLARCAAPVDLRRAVTALEAHARVGEAWSVEEIVLFESRLGSGGATHTERARIGLRRAGPDGA